MIRRRFYQQDKEVFDRDNYLTFEVLLGDFTFTFPSALEYNINGDGWKKLEAEEQSPFIGIGDFISLRANLIPAPYVGIGVFNLSQDTELKLSGNCMSLLFGDKAHIKNSLRGLHSAFRSLFRGWSSCIKEVSSNFLPATELSPYCYDSMFNYNTVLESAPNLPATTLDEGCYTNMFQDCTSLVNAPVLPATTLTSYCYSNMFDGCTKLNYIKMLATNISAIFSLYDWVRDVSPTGTFVKSKDATWDVVGDSGVPTGWTVITDDQEGEGGEITFYVDDVAYTALDSMTWGEYINSEYNENVFGGDGTPYEKFTVAEEGYIQIAILDNGLFDIYMMIHTGGWAPIYTSEKIINNQKYIAD